MVARARFCDRCGAAQGVAVILPSAPAELAPSSASNLGAGRWRSLWIGALLLSTGAGAALAASWLLAPPPPATGQLQSAVRSALASGLGPGSDPICVANGLAYDQSPVNVQQDNALTVGWMNTLVAAGLYQAPVESASGALSPQPVLVYRPLPALAQWAGPRRLCIAKAVKLQRIGRVGPVEDMRLRGQRYIGVPADVVWTLEQPAPWLDNPEVAQAFARELPTWRGARWQTGASGWQLTQRKHFLRIDADWVTSERAERLHGATATAAPI